MTEKTRDTVLLILAIVLSLAALLAVPAVHVTLIYMIVKALK